MSKFSKNFGSSKTQENAFDKPLERLSFWEILGGFLDNFRKILQSLGNDFELISRKIIFRKIVGKLSVNVRNIFVFTI